MRASDHSEWANITIRQKDVMEALEGDSTSGKKGWVGGWVGVVS